MKAEAEIKDAEEYKQCQEMLSSSSGTGSAGTSSSKRLAKKPPAEKDEKEKWMKWASSAINELQRMQAKFEDINEKIYAMKHKPWWTKSMEKSLAKQSSSIVAFLQKIIKMNAIGSALQPTAFQEKHYEATKEDMQTIKTAFDDKNQPFQQVKTLVATFST
eukprot:9211353-Lingulodinium_polyedra.AAC.1